MSDTFILGATTKMEGETNVRSRNWVLTCNNWTEEQYRLIANNATKIYAVIGKEVGLGGTPHLQCKLITSRHLLGDMFQFRKRTQSSLKEPVWETEEWKQKQERLDTLLAEIREREWKELVEKMPVVSISPKPKT